MRDKAESALRGLKAVRSGRPDVSTDTAIDKAKVAATSQTTTAASA